MDATVTNLRFFESGFDTPSREDRVFANVFSRHTARYVNWQIDLDYPSQPQRRDFEIKVVFFRPDGSIFARQTTDSYVALGWSASLHSSGHGWRESENWKAGAYWVELYVEDRLVASGGFEIVDRIVPMATTEPTATPTPTPEPLMSYREVVDLVQPSIVRLATDYHSGSGFIIQTLENSAYVATNRHVVEGDTGTVTAIVGDRAIYPGVVIGEDDRYDFAVVWICCSESFQTLPLAEDARETKSGPSATR